MVPVYIWVIAGVLGLVFIAKGLKALLITHTFSVSRNTQDGESYAAQASSTIFSSEHDRFELVQELMRHGDERLAFADARFKAQIQKEIDEKDEKKLKSV